MPDEPLNTIPACQARLNDLWQQIENARDARREQLAGAIREVHRRMAELVAATQLASEEMTAYAVVEGLEPEHIVHFATGSGYHIDLIAADLRVLMGRWRVMDDLPVCLVEEGSLCVVYAGGEIAEESDWLFSFSTSQEGTPT